MQYHSSPDKLTRDFLDSLLLESRYIDADIATTEVELFGCKFATPIMTAALSHLGSRGRKSADFIEHPALNGMIVYAEAAARSNTLHWVGMGDDRELEDIVATGAKTVKVVKPLADNAEVLREIRHAVETGCVAVSMDIDHAFNGTGGYDCIFGQEMRPICSCHLKDIRLREEYTFQLQECACGDGALDIARYISLANQENPRMPMIIEHLGSDEEYEQSVRMIQALGQ